MLYTDKRGVVRDVDCSDVADAARFRFILAGAGYFMEEQGLCGHNKSADDADAMEARIAIDEAMIAGI